MNPELHQKRIERIKEVTGMENPESPSEDDLRKLYTFLNVGAPHYIEPVEMIGT